MTHLWIVAHSAGSDSRLPSQLDIPAFDWPAVPWPATKYPLDEYASENAEAEARTIALVEETIISHAKKGKKVAALIVEPVQAEGGDNHASPNFFKALRTVTRVRLICSCIYRDSLDSPALLPQEHGGSSCLDHSAYSAAPY